MKMKKIKKIIMLNILTIMAMLFMAPVAYAHDVTTSTKITIPLDLNSKVKIQVDESFGKYELFYQYVSMDDDDYDAYMELEEEQIAYMSEHKPGSDATETEIAEYKSIMRAYEDDKNNYKPEYDETKWTKSTDGTVKFNVKGASEGEPFVLWVKVVSTEDEDLEPIFNEKVITYDVKMESEEPDEQSPATSDNMLIIGVFAVAAVGLLAISYKKVRA